MLQSWLLQDFADASAHSTRMTMGELAMDPQRPDGAPIMWNPMMTLVRSGEIFGIIQAEDPGTLAMVLDTCISGFAPDVITVVVDTYTTNVDINPRTGEPWRHNELGEYMMLNPGCNVLLRPPEQQGDEVFVSDALDVIAANRAGDLVTQVLPYRVVGNEVRWNRVTAKTDGEKNSLADTVRRFMLRPTIEHALGVKGGVPDYFARQMAADDADVRRAKLDISLAQYLRMHFHLTIQMDIIPGSKRDEIFQSLPGWRVVGDHLEFGDEDDGWDGTR